MRTLASLIQAVGLVVVVAATAALSPAAAVIVVGLLLVALGTVLELRARP